jgi:type I restriction enzyme S subunit
MTEWREISLGDACVRLRSGSNITAADIKETGDFPVFGGNGVRGYSSESNFSGECAIIGRQGAYCGNVRFFRGTARMSEHAIVACANSQNNTQFLAYLLSTLNLGRLSGQAAQPGLSVKVLAQQQLLLPPLETQIRIASIVDVIDDLIANNRRRADVTEEMARAIYDEWFVKFRYPGHEDVPLVATALGPIPSGWTVVRIADLCTQINSGSTPKRSVAAFWSDPEVDWYKTGDLTDSILLSSSEQISRLAATKVRMFEPDTILFAIYGATIGRLGLLACKASANQAALGLLADPTVSSTEHLWFALENLRSHLITIAQGAAQQNVSKEKVASAAVVRPPREIVDEFTDRVRAPWRLSHELQKQTATLTELRDLLLPKLVTGQIDISSLDLGVLVRESVA